MTLEQIATHIDNNNWAFTIVKTKPTYERIAHHAFKVDNTAEYIRQIVAKTGATEIQIIPEKKNGNSYRTHIAKTITINFNNNSETMEDQNINLNTLAGLSGLGLNMADVFTAKEKAAEIEQLKQKIQLLEENNKRLERDNQKLENKIEIDKIKQNQKSELMELFKNPQIISLATSILSRGQTTPALTGATPAQTSIDEKMKWIISYLNDDATPEQIKDLMIYIAKAQQHENGVLIIKQIADILIDNSIIPPKTEEINN